MTLDGVQSSLKAISSDLSKIKDAQGDLSGDRRQQVQDATKTFTSQVQSIAGSIVKSTSLSDAKAQLTSALQQLGAAYKQSFAAGRLQLVSDENPVPAAAAFGEQVSWQPATPRLRPLRLVVSWVVAAASIWVAAAIVPGVGLEQHRRRVRRRGADRGAQRGAAARAGRAAPAVHARGRLPARPARRRARCS